MALATSTIIALATAAAAAGAQAYNTQKTAKRQDRALATDIRNQGEKRREGEARTNAEIEKLKLSTSEDERQKKLTAYTDALRKKQGEITSGLTNGVGGDTFQQDAQTAAQGAVDYGMGNADTMSRIDAPLDQRVGEGVSFGNLGIDMNTIAREAQGRHFLDQLRYNSIRRNPWIDAGAQVLSSVGGAMAGGGMAGGGIEKNGLSEYTKAIKMNGTTIKAPVGAYAPTGFGMNISPYTT